MAEIPIECTLYKRTPTFSASNVPPGLLSRHNTKVGTWGKIVVEMGSLEYTIFGPPELVSILTPDTPGIIKPQEYHKVALLSSNTEFHVEFYAASSKELKTPNFLKASEILATRGEVVEPDTLKEGDNEEIISFKIVSMIVLVGVTWKR